MNSTAQNSSQAKYFRNIFLLCTGRCGSSTFIKAASHIINYSAGHETQTQHLGQKRFDYANHHIEADNRLSWLLGRLEKNMAMKHFISI
jgi:hypothetical protein